MIPHLPQKLRSHLVMLMVMAMAMMVAEVRMNKETNQQLFIWLSDWWLKEQFYWSSLFPEL